MKHHSRFDMPRTNKNLIRVFVSNSLQQDALIDLERNKANHLINVLRKKTGDELIVFNGIDGAWLVRIESTSKKSASLSLLKQIARQPKPSDIYYGFAPLKKARLDYMMQKATEMGAGIIQPIITQYTQNPKINIDKIKANVIEAAQQCEVLNLPKIEQAVRLKNLVENWQEIHGERKLILADESKQAASPIKTLESLRGQKIGLLIGPEGGFSDEELSLLHSKDFIVPISLGERILRADTAAVAALALIQAVINL